MFAWFWTITQETGMRSGQSKCYVSFIVNELKREQGKNIWICGGANIIQQLIKKGETDWVQSENVEFLNPIPGFGGH